MFFYNVLLEKTDIFEISINGLPKNPELNRAFLDRHSPVDVAVFKHIGTTIENKNEGSAKLQFRYAYPKNVIAVKDKIKQGVMSDVMHDAMKYIDSSALEGVNVASLKYHVKL
jgi:hypothetical protein